VETRRPETSRPAGLSTGRIRAPLHAVGLAGTISPRGNRPGL